jgi:hypothetical protein
MRIYQAAGFTIGFAMAELLSFNSRLWVLLSAAILATLTLCSVIIELTTQSKEELLPYIYRRRTPASRAEKSESGGSMNEDQAEHESVYIEPTDRELSGATTRQNPIFLEYQGRRPSAMSDWSADSLDLAVSASNDSNDKGPQEHDPSYSESVTAADPSSVGTVQDLKVHALSPIRESEDKDTDSINYS